MARAGFDSATFRCGDCTVIARYLGDRQWELSGPASNWSGPHHEVAVAICNALGLGGEIPYNTKMVEVSAANVTGTIKNNTFPTDLWFVDINGVDRSWAGAEKPLAAAIIACLTALRLTPLRVPSVPPKRLEQERFGRAVLDAAIDPVGWAQRLGRALSERLRSAVDAESEVLVVVQELKALGHDLWRFDQSEDFATWTYDYGKPPPGRRLLIHFAFAAYEEPEVEVTVQDPCQADGNAKPIGK